MKTNNAHSRLARGRRKATRPLVGAVLLAGMAGVSSGVIAEEEKTLSTVTVKATAEQPDGYKATKTRVGKVVQDPHDIPQAITTVTRALIEEQEANTLREAMRNVSGVSFNAAEGGRSGDNMNLRSFYTFGDVYLDGIRDTAQYNRELFYIEQVDVLRGAAAMLFGRGQAGGVINQVSKTPMLYGINKVSAGIGTDGYWETSADLNQRLGDTTAFRFNVMSREEGSSRSNPVTGASPENKRMGAAPSISFGLGTDNELTLSHLWTQSNDRPDYGVPFANGKPNETYAKAGTYWGLAGSFDDSETNVTTINYLHKFAPDTQWRTVLRRGQYWRSYWASAPQGAIATGGSAKTREFQTEDLVLQSDFNTKFNVFGMGNELVTGIEVLNEDSKRWALRNVGTTANPLYMRGVYTTSIPTNTYQGTTYSAYVQDTLEFVKNWKLMAGIRRDDMRSEYSAGATSFSGNFQENSYRAGLSWQPTADAHYYVSWSDSFSPTADLYQLSGSMYPAERSKVYEVGAKWLLLDGNASFRTAAYHAVKDWERNSDLESTASILTKKRKADGLELELSGAITDKWQAFAGVSYTVGKILEVSPSAPNNSAVGKTPRNTPRWTSNVWTSYDLGWGFKAGGGFEYKSKRNGYQPTGTYSNPNTNPGYIRWDAMLTYEQPKYTVKLNVQNVFDKLYYDAIYDNGGFTYIGQPRRVILSTEYKF